MLLAHSKVNLLVPFFGLYSYNSFSLFLTRTHTHTHTDVVEQFGIESILIYNALLLKKKVAVYAANVETLLKTCRLATDTNLYHTVWRYTYMCVQDCHQVSWESSKFLCVHALYIVTH